jgi:hypothetical protein
LKITELLYIKIYFSGLEKDKSFKKVNYFLNRFSKILSSVSIFRNNKLIIKMFDGASIFYYSFHQKKDRFAKKIKKILQRAKQQLFGN